MTYFADLHTHSTASDGQYRSVELVKLAGNRGLEVLALTDHDTLEGLNEAFAAAISAESASNRIPACPWNWTGCSAS